MTIEQRLAAVERQLRFHRLVIAGLLVALVALVGYGATEGVPDVIRARSFEVVNPEGQAVIAARADKDGGGLWLYNVEGQLVVVAHAGKDGGGVLALYNAEGQSGVGAAALKDGGGLALYNAKGQQGVVADAGVIGGRLTLYNADEKETVILRSRALLGGGGAVVVKNKTGEEVVQAKADEYGMGYIGAFDRQGKGRTLTPR